LTKRNGVTTATPYKNITTCKRHICTVVPWNHISDDSGVNNIIEDVPSEARKEKEESIPSDIFHMTSLHFVYYYMFLFLLSSLVARISPLR
jgi:hypothetical protein